jgi:hypothetical protein
LVVSVVLVYSMLFVPTLFPPCPIKLIGIKAIIHQIKTHC